MVGSRLRAELGRREQDVAFLATREPLRERRDGISVGGAEAAGSVAVS